MDFFRCHIMIVSCKQRCYEYSLEAIFWAEIAQDRESSPARDRRSTTVPRQYIMFILQYKVSTTVLDLIVVFALLVFALVRLCFCVATGFRWIKIYISGGFCSLKWGRSRLTISQGAALRVGRMAGHLCPSINVLYARPRIIHARTGSSPRQISD